MIASQSIAALIAALIHPSAATVGQDRARHQTFILRTLILVFLALAVAPFFLAFHGAPTSAQTAVFGFCLAPLGAVMLVSKTGRLTLGHLICVCCLIGAGITLAIATQASLACALAWLIVAQTESLLSFDRKLVLWTAVVSALSFCGLAAAGLTGWIAHPGAAVHGDLFVGVALAYAIANAACIVGLRTRTRTAAQAEHGRTKAIADAVGDLVVSYDRQGAVDFVSRDCARLFNIRGDDLLGHGLFEHVHVADRPIFLKAIADAAHQAGTATATFRLRSVDPEPRRDGGYDATFLWIEMRANRLPGSNAGVVSLLRDVTETKRDAAALEAAREAAETASRSKDHFLANMSHELRTPLNAIIGFSEMLGDADLRPKDPAKQSEYARIIHQSGQHLLAVVNSMLDMAKIQSGTFSIDPEPFLVMPLIDSCCEIVTLKAQEGGVEIVKTAAGALESVVGDRRACKQILINLLSNAVKFTPANGRVTVVAKPEGTSLSICVSDTGIGIGPADLARLGDPFFQVKSAFDRPYEGTGLGLSVVRGLVGLHGGTIAIESELGHGTSVTIRLPLDCRFVTPNAGSATIETLPRRRASDRFASPPHATRVKKIA
ncbi:PAS domain-containing sensor histidine kinase [Beijerinckia sp. L45]|uniref:PAS domain-containing sensor histidine kinase n=1 Tax=Beijerinckia sp. L45 TaxID=1641855 RepID=UPI00131AF818|nr:PAS domain-containing sensor histidine kinase [Beijerinckia sp. L45]